MCADKSPPFDAMHGFTRMRERTKEARDREADRVFGAANLNAVLSAAAAKGQSAALFAPSSPMDLSEAVTAKRTKAILESAGFVTEWKIMRATPDSEPHTVLRVSWGAEAAGRK